ncbi:MAG TPA: hypothetical protein VLF89_08410 [Candidatus Saccharimonadales bacterium]|nr:hypothetical protein [Candidatus Saccharimonadales bacterium]
MGKIEQKSFDTEPLDKQIRPNQAIAVGDFSIAQNEIGESLGLHPAMMEEANAIFTNDVVHAVLETKQTDLGIVTGRDVLGKVLQEFPVLEEGEKIGLVNLAQYTYGLQSRVRVLGDLLGKKDLLFQRTPVETVVFSRGIFYGMTGKGDKGDRAEEAGQHNYIHEQMDKTLTALITQGVQDIILIDDRASAQYTSLQHAAQRFTREDFRVIGYAVGHTGGVQYDSGGSLALAPDGTPVCAVRARYETPEHQEYYERLGIHPDPATELADLGYFQGGGAAHIEGYQEASEIIKATYRGLNAILNNPSHAEAEIKLLEQHFGVIIGDRNNLNTFLQEISNNGLRVTASDIQKLFRIYDGKQILIVPHQTKFNPDLISRSVRTPELWPGSKPQKSFWDIYNTQEWGNVSLSILRATAKWIESIEYMKPDAHIPATALPLTGLINVQKLMPSKIRENNKALDYIHNLIITLEEAMGERKYISISSAEETSLFNGSVDNGKNLNLYNPM